MVWNAFMENEEVQKLSKIPKMSDLVGVIKEIKTMRQDDKNLDKLKARNATILRHEIKSVELQYLNMWKKFKKDKNYTEAFLGINAHLSFLYLKYNDIQIELNKYVHPLVLRQTKLRFKQLKLEEKYEGSSEIIRERKILQNENYAILNRKNREECSMLQPHSINSSRAELKVVKKEFLEIWKQYKDSKSEKEFLKISDKYAKMLSKIKGLENQINKMRKNKPYLKMLRENYIRYSILEDKLLDTWRNI